MRMLELEGETRDNFPDLAKLRLVQAVVEDLPVIYRLALLPAVALARGSRDLVEHLPI